MTDIEDRFTEIIRDAAWRGPTQLRSEEHARDVARALLRTLGFTQDDLEMLLDYVIWLKQGFHHDSSTAPCPVCGSSPFWNTHSDEAVAFADLAARISALLPPQD